MRAFCLAFLTLFAVPAAAQKLDATPRTVVMTAFAPEYEALVHRSRSREPTSSTASPS